MTEPESEGEKGWGDLSEHLVLRILRELDKDSFMIASQVCSLWNKVVGDNIEYFTSYFGDEGEDEELQDELEESQKMTLQNADGSKYSQEQKLMADQVNRLGKHQVYEMLGISEQADDDEIRASYKKLALGLHPDKNRAPGAQQAFQSLKGAFDAIMSGVNPDAPGMVTMSCPSESCMSSGGVSVYLPAEKQKAILAGKDIGYCRVCKSQFGRIFCFHCYSAWTMPLKTELHNTHATCSACFRQFTIQFPQPAPPTINDKKRTKQTTLKVVKKQKQWWEL
ncbi:chaperone protein dnaJ 49 [Planoprotostelium fungivorum]|uniref:Chaperone protein dnaJ 49 n=1 Tax=Planoprotostelium fungivorum TaxID=1890364 RepID=A0A2P6NAS7_9EUKA|nr:chaperone protein dnaJ 49 [Planoprotostelium fungivorum]